MEPKNEYVIEYDNKHKYNDKYSLENEYNKYLYKNCFKNEYKKGLYKKGLKDEYKKYNIVYNNSLNKDIIKSEKKNTNNDKQEYISETESETESDEELFINLELDSLLNLEYSHLDNYKDSIFTNSDCYDISDNEIELNLDLTFDTDIRDSLIDYGDFITQKFINYGCNILSKNGYNESKNNQTLLEILWNYKCIEGQFKENSKYSIINKFKKVANLYRRGIGWLFCLRLQKGKRWIFNRYLKNFIHEGLKLGFQNKIDKFSKEPLEYIKEIKNKQILEETKIINKIVNKIFYIPKGCNRKDIIVLPFDKIENIIKIESGYYLDFENDVNKNLWILTKKQITYALISLFTSFGIIELAINSIIFI